jgi:serine/threonine-protein kinase
MCPNCSFDNLDEAQGCAQCGFMLRGLLAANAILNERYQVLQVLGFGAMGAVYLAQDKRLVERKWAIKENRPSSQTLAAVQAQAHEQFLAEANTLARLDHPGLPKVYDFFIEDGREYLVMDYVAGQDLIKLLQKVNAPLNEDLVLSWADQVLDALAYLHSQSPQPIIHRDIKPANLRLTSQNKIKLVDFGLVKLHDADSPETKADLRGLGTPAYAPLEQFAGSDKHTDARSDLYSLGTTLYHLLTQLPPAEVHQRLLDPGILVSPRGLNSKLSEETAQVILKAMAIHPDNRYQSAQEMRQAIAEARQAAAAATPSKSATRFPVSPWVFGLSGLILVLLILGGIAFLVFGRNTEPQATPELAVVIVAETATAGPTKAVTPSTLTNAPTAIPTPVIVPTATTGPIIENTPTVLPTPTPEPTATLTSAPEVVQPGGIPASTLAGTIAYPVFNGQSYDLYFGQADGTGTRFFQAGASQPAFSPDGNRIAFRSWKIDNRGLVTMNIDGTNQNSITIFFEDQLPTWSADGREIILLSRRAGDRKSQLIKVSSAGENGDGLIISEGEYPTLGPNNEFIFRGWGTTGTGLIFSSISFDNRQRLTDLNEDTAPAISPSGQEIAFMSRRDGNWEIYVMDIDGSNLQRLTADPAQDGLPTWSPDGKALAFVSDRQGQWAIWAMAPAGDDQQQLFAIEGSPDGFVGTDAFSSRGWAEERISWTR